MDSIIHHVDSTVCSTLRQLKDLYPGAALLSVAYIEDAIHELALRILIFDDNGGLLYNRATKLSDVTADSYPILKNWAVNYNIRFN